MDYPNVKQGPYRKQITNSKNLPMKHLMTRLFRGVVRAKGINKDAELPRVNREAVASYFQTLISRCGGSSKSPVTGEATAGDDTSQKIQQQVQSMPDQQPGSVEQRKCIPAYLCTIIFYQCFCQPLVSVGSSHWLNPIGSLAVTVCTSQLLGAKSTESG